MKVLTVLGSPRIDGNSTRLAKVFNEVATGAGADVSTVTLNTLSFRGCQACDACKTVSERCVLKDELTPVLEAVEQTDVLVLATPVYFSDVSAQTKAFIDRCYSFLVPYTTVPEKSRLPEGKRMVFIVTQNWPDEDVFKDVFPRYDAMFNALGFQDNRCIRGCSLGTSDALATNNRDDLILLAKKTAQELFG
jgi:multimeric flavodoxin WrbA